MIEKAKPLLFLLLTLCLVLLLVEMTCVAIVLVREKDAGLFAKHFPVVDILRWRQGKDDVRSKYLEMESDYFVFDPNLGTRFRPNSRVVSLESDEDGNPRIAATRFLAVDRYGYISNSTEATNTIDYASIANDPTVYRILVSGGSTAAGWGASANQNTWAAVLERLLNSEIRDVRTNYERVAVINSGVLGYNISQEIRRFQEETLYLNPHLVIAFNGINEIWGYKGNPVKYTFRGPQNRLVEHLNYGPPRRTWTVLPYFSMAFASGGERPPLESLYGYQTTGYLELTGTNLYLSKIHQFKSLCDGAGVEFRYALQPLMGIGEKALTAEEQKYKKFFGSSMYRISWEDYRSKAREFFTEVSDRLTEPWQIDMSHLFDSETRTVYADPRHYNDLGQRSIAEALAERIKEDGLLTRGRNFTVSKKSAETEDSVTTCTVTRTWAFWYEQMMVSVNENGESIEYLCQRPLSAPRGMPWKCVCKTDPGTSPIHVQLDENGDSDYIGKRLLSAFQKTRWLTKEFEAATDVALKIDGYVEADGWRHNETVAFEKLPEGFSLKSSGENPIVILPAFSWPPDTQPILKIEVTSPKASFMEVFYLRKGQEKYGSDQRFLERVSKGKNVVFFPLREANPGSALRLDPGNTPCEYTIHSIEVRAVPRR